MEQKTHFITRYSRMAIVVVALLLTACDDFLDVKPTTELDRDELFKSERGFVDAITGVYAQMASADMYGRDLTIVIPDALAGYYSYSSKTQLWTTYAYLHDNPSRNENAISAIDAVWGNMYNNIANLNSLLASIDGHRGVFSGSDYSIIKGEALGLHAFLHFELVRMFTPAYALGDDEARIPFATELSTSIQPLLPTSEVMKRIIGELKQARELMADDPIRLGTTPNENLAPVPSQTGIDDYHNRRFRFNYYAAVATLARAYLWMGDKQNALACAREIIADQPKRFPWVKTENLTNIGSDGASAYHQDRLFTTEHIFAMNTPQLETYLDGYTWLGSLSVSSVYLPLSYDITSSLYDGKDIRSQYLFGKIGYYNVTTKYTQTKVVYDYYRYRVPLIRLSEMYYIAAECETDAAQAKQYLETVRQHRGLSDTPLGDNADLTAEIAKEYRKEFLAEGQLWYYYKRTNAASIPNAYSFKSADLYTFDRPEKEDTYANR